MADQTYQFPCDNTAYVDIVVQSPSCSRITVGEYYTSSAPATTDLFVKQPSTAATGAPVLQGTSMPLTPNGGYFQKGQVIGSVKTAAGSVTIQQIEGQQA